MHECMYMYACVLKRLVLGTSTDPKLTVFKFFIVNAVAFAYNMPINWIIYETQS